MRSLTFCLILIFAAMPFLSGCASKYGTQKTSVNYYPACYRPIAELRKSEHDVAKTTAGGAALGAIGGALLGLLASGGKWEGAVAGAAAGGVAGTMAGNIYAKKQKEADDNRRLASYLQDIDGDISNLDIEKAAAKNSLQCYDGQFKKLLGQIKARKIARPAAQERFAEISAGREEAIAILGNAASQGQNLSQEYEKAFINEEEQIKTQQKTAEGRQAYQKKAEAIQTARKRKAALDNKTGELKIEKAQAQNQSQDQLKEFNDALSDART